MSRTTIKDLAAYTGLSLGTISKYINGGKVKPKNKELIDDATKALHFNVNQFARGLRTNKSKTIGVLIPSLENFFSTTLVAYIEDELYKHEFSVMVCAYQEDPHRERAQLRFLQQKNVDAIVIVPTSSFETARMVRDIIDNGTYVIAVDRKLQGIKCDVIEINNFQIAYDVTSYLIKMGHTRIGLLGTGQTTLTAIERYQGYGKALSDAGIDEDQSLVGFGNNFSSGAYRQARRFLKMADRPSAVFATNYDTTLGALMAINELKLKVPDDVSLVGFDNLSVAKVFNPSLTIVAQPMQEIAQQTVEKILSSVDHPDTDGKDLVLKGYIVYGSSVLEKRS